MPYKEPAPITIRLELRKELDIIRQAYGVTWGEFLQEFVKIIKDEEEKNRGG